MGILIQHDSCDACGRAYTLHMITGDESIVNDGRCQECFDKHNPRTSSAIYYGLLSILAIAIIFYLISEYISRS